MTDKQAVQATTDHAGALRLLASGAAWQCGETATMLEDAADEIERLWAALDILQAAMVAVNPIPMRHKRAINQARAKLQGAA
jgi:hypothetical protein